MTSRFNGWTAACEQALAWYSMPRGRVNVSLVGSCLGGWWCGEVISEGAAILQQEIVDDLLRLEGCEVGIPGECFVFRKRGLHDHAQCVSVGAYQGAVVSIA